MNYFPRFYETFNCKASECKDTCCKDWNIYLDNKSKDMLECFNRKYPNLASNSIIEKDGISYINFHNGVCPFLNTNKMCEIQRRGGIEYLCYSCREYPRKQIQIGNDTKYTLSLSCEKSVSLVLKHMSLEGLIIPNTSNKLILLQNEIIKKVISNDVQLLSQNEKNSIINCFSKMDITDSALKNRIVNIALEQNGLKNDEIKKLTGFYIWSLFDGNNLNDVKHISAFMINLYSVFLSGSPDNYSEKEYLIHKLSKEIEHCDKNLELIREC